jgi:glycosyltransferase involved in cell wall biosynthesis
MGKPVIATEVGGIPEIVTSGVTGALIPPEDPVALAKAMIQTLGDPESARRLGEGGRRLVEQEYTVEKMAEKVYRVYQQVYERKQRN